MEPGPINFEFCRSYKGTKLRKLSNIARFTNNHVRRREDKNMKLAVYAYDKWLQSTVWCICTHLRVPPAETTQIDQVHDDERHVKAHSFNGIQHFHPLVGEVT